jgi:hypothetical protein
MVTSEIRFLLVLISASITLLAVMIVVGEIDFFEDMTCDELKIYVDTMPEDKYPLGTPFTPSQIEFLNETYNENCI